MILMLPKTRLFEEHEIPTEGRDVLHAQLMLPKPPCTPKRLVFIAPLVGAGASHPLLTFRNLTRRGSILLSFEYRGHPRSSGTFDLDKTILDVRHALLWASSYAEPRGLPLHGFATCYGVIPLAAQFAEDGGSTGLWSFSAISGLFRLDHILRFEDFANVLSRHLGRELSRATFLAGIARQAFDWHGDPFRHALREYLNGLFPELRVGRDCFEELGYERVDIPRTLTQLAEARYLDGITVPPEVPCSFFFGRNDDVLSLCTPEGREAYRKQILSLTQHAELHECEIDHFGRGPEHDAVIRGLGDFLEQCEARSVVPPFAQEVLPAQRTRA